MKTLAVRIGTEGLREPLQVRFNGKRYEVCRDHLVWVAICWLWADAVPVRDHPTGELRNSKEAFALIPCSVHH